jgi:hypothetical protein
LGAGAVEFLSKPIDADQLTALLAEVLPDRPVPQHPRATAIRSFEPPEAARGVIGSGRNRADDMTRYAGFKLLIVDDHAHNLFTLRT